MSVKRNHIKVFFSSTVYDFETDLRRVFATLDGFGYDVYMSKEGTIPLDSRLSNLINCVKGVEECDVFLGIIPSDSLSSFSFSESVKSYDNSSFAQL